MHSMYSFTFFSSILLISFMFILNGTNCVKIVDPNRFSGIGFTGFGSGMGRVPAKTKTRTSSARNRNDLELNRATATADEHEETLCNCKGAPANTLFCGNNGITYRSTCKFECDKKTNSRLAVLKQGKACEGLTQADYFRGRRK